MGKREIRGTWEKDLQLRAEKETDEGRGVKVEVFATACEAEKGGRT